MKPFLVLSFVCLTILAIFFSGCTSYQPSQIVPPVSPTLTSAPAASSCGFTTCHGLDLACGANAPQVCPMVYQLGDKCRQYAYCDNSGGSCKLNTTPQFDSCKACVEKCGGADATEILTCEEKC